MIRCDKVCEGWMDRRREGLRARERESGLGGCECGARTGACLGRSAGHEPHFLPRCPTLPPTQERDLARMAYCMSMVAPSLSHTITGSG